MLPGFEKSLQVRLTDTIVIIFIITLTSSGRLINTPARHDNNHSRDIIISSQLPQEKDNRRRSTGGSHTPRPNLLGSESISDLLTSGPIDEDNEHLFGKSSTAAFIKTLEHTILQTHGEDTIRTSQYISSPNKKKTAQARSAVKYGHDVDTSTFSLPARKQADQYINNFWQYMHSVHPILHKPSFNSSYRSIWIAEEEQSGHDRPATDDPIFLATLSIVFAIGCSFTETIDPSRRTILIERFYQQSRNLFSIDEVDSVSLTTVQLLLLTGIYLLNSKYTNRCWNVIGLAIRNAQTLGLHEESRKRAYTQIEREMRRRVWYNCISLDKLVAAVFGRPYMISSPSSILLPLLIDDEYLLSEGEGQQPANTVSYVGLFLYSFKLFEMMSDVLKMVYHQKETSFQNTQPGTCTSWWRPNILDNILKLDTTLDTFLSSLPPHLRIQQNSVESWTETAENMQWRQAKILQCRFASLRILSNCNPFYIYILN